MIVIGVDAHTRTHTAAAVNSQTAVELHTLTVQATRPGHEQLLAWARTSTASGSGRLRTAGGCPARWNCCCSRPASTQSGCHRR
jgi:transposase